MASSSSSTSKDGVVVAPVSSSKGEATLESADAEVAASGDVLELLPHRGRAQLYTETRSGRCYLIHIETMEKIFADANMHLEFDDDGFGCLLGPNDTDACVLLEDVLERQLGQRSDGDLIVEEKKPHQAVKSWSLSERQRQHEEIKVHFPVSSLAATVEMEVFHLRWPRQSGSRFLFAARSLLQCAAVIILQKPGLKMAGQKPGELEETVGAFACRTTRLCIEAEEQTARGCRRPHMRVPALARLVYFWSCGHAEQVERMRAATWWLPQQCRQTSGT